ncbi:hypothetical protein Elgi_59120 [Paenibacillus elgii]|nr:hypothetical protein Elgi_59120 [Paenibacillus elgii]
MTNDNIVYLFLYRYEKNKRKRKNFTETGRRIVENVFEKLDGSLQVRLPATIINHHFRR